MSHIKTTRFWLLWILASLLVYPLTALLVFAFSMIWIPLIESFTPSASDWHYASQTIDEFLVFLTVTAYGGIVGLAVGLLQANVIKRYFHFTPRYWKRATVVGGLVGAPVMVLTLFGLHEYMSANYWQLAETGQFQTLNLLLPIMPMMLYVTVMSVIQMIVLRQYVRNAWLWIVANAIAGLMFSMLATVTFNPGLGDWLLAAIAQGAITGFAMLWLLHRLNREDAEAEKSEYAYQHVPIDMDDD